MRQCRKMKIMVEPEAEITIWRMRAACWVSKDTREMHRRSRIHTHTHSNMY